MAVSIQRQLNAGVPEALLNDLRMNSAHQQVRGVTMAEIMHPDYGESAPTHHLNESIR